MNGSGSLILKAHKTSVKKTGLVIFSQVGKMAMGYCVTLGGSEFPSVHAEQTHNIKHQRKHDHRGKAEVNGKQCGNNGT